MKRRRWRKYQTRARVTERVPALNGTIAEHHYDARLVEEFGGWLILADVVALEAGKNREDVPLKGEKWIRRETIVHLQRFEA